MKERDIIIIGGGPGGYELAAKAASRGLATTLIERDKLGGTCLNRGCIPTKALLRSACVAAITRQAAEFGVDAAAVTTDYAGAVSRKDGIVAELREGIASMLATAGVEVVTGNALFTGKNVVEVNEESYSAPRIVIATGSRPALLDIPGSSLAITSDDLLKMSELPQSVVIIGGGVIGMEFAGILHEFGVKVTVIEYCKEILPPFDRDIAKRLRTVLSRRGIDIIVDAKVTSIEPGKVNYERKGKPATVEAALALMAVGRHPVVPEMPEDLGLELERGFIKVDDHMATSLPGVYAIGDVNGICMLAHAASAQGDIVLGECRRVDVIPATVFTSPECAMVGLTEEQSKERGMDIKVGKALFRANGKALSLGETDGLVKLIANAVDGRIIGCHIMGPHASDLIQVVSNMMALNATVDDMCRAVYGHPTLSEVLYEAARAAR